MLAGLPSKGMFTDPEPEELPEPLSSPLDLTRAMWNPPIKPAKNAVTITQKIIAHG